MTIVRAQSDALLQYCPTTVDEAVGSSPFGAAVWAEGLGFFCLVGTRCL